MDLLNIKVIDKTNEMNIEVLLKPEYLSKFGETPFYKYWLSKYTNLFNIVIIYNYDLLQLYHFAFFPKRLQISSDYVYDLMTEPEKNYFKGLGHKLLCGMIKYGLDRKYYHKNARINVQPTELYFADSLRDEMNDIEATVATASFKKLVQYYEFIGFELDYNIDWDDPRYNVVPKVTAFMHSTVETILSRCVF